MANEWALGFERGSERSGVSLYLQLSDTFRSRIERGEWVVGARIPTVEELSKAYSVSGMTIRQALGILENEGLIERFRAKGTFVRAQPQRDLWCDVKTDMSGLLQARPGAAIRVLGDVMVPRLPASVKPELDGDSDRNFRHLRRLHSRDGVQFLLADVYISEHVAHLVKPEDLTSKTAMRLVADLPGVSIADAKQVLTIEKSDYELARALDVPVDSPVVRVVRIAYDDEGRTLMTAIGKYVSEMIRIEMRLR